ncbi:hypothetical protein LTR60_003713 [Cryomyces antarcticus]|nr:hypothetical protein LTR60_003713 [Cryomyces antarcticus]
MPLAALTAMGAVFNSLTGGYLSGLMGAGGTKPLKADLVGEAVVEAIADERVKGPVETGEIEELANRAIKALCRLYTPTNSFKSPCPALAPSLMERISRHPSACAWLAPNHSHLIETPPGVLCWEHAEFREGAPSTLVQA